MNVGKLIPPRDFYLARSGPWFLTAFLIATLAFWPSYLSLGPRGSNIYTHLHATLATLWMALLITQPMLIRTGKLRLHRKLGRISLVLAPAFVIAVVLLANYRIRGAEGPGYGFQTYVLWLQISLAALFALSYVLAMAMRKSMPHHARFMICTGITLIDPVVVRLMLWADNTPDWNYQWLTFGLTDLAFVGLIWAERKLTAARWIFPVMLAVFVIAQVPALFGMTRQAWWQDFAAWFASLPLT